MAATPRSSSATPRRTRKHCSVEDCVKVDAGGGFCVSHGGGKKCSFPGCEKGYQTGGFCRKHGGGARCQVPGCGKVDAGKGLCRGHGGGKRCQAQDCHKADVGGGLCTAHGGGKRCAEPGCTKIDQGGGKCRAHGGAKRCRHAGGCSQTARGASGLCPDHGGAKICSVANCRRLARTSANGTDSTLCSACGKEQRAVDNGDTLSNRKHSARLMPQHRVAVTPASRRSTSKPTVSPTSSTQSDVPSDSDEPMAPSSPAIVTPPIAPTVHAMYSPPLTLTLPEPMLERDASVGPCDGSHVASCLENGCARSFGGACSCARDCQCNQTAAAQAVEASEDVRTPAILRVERAHVSALALMRYVVAIELSSEHLSWLSSDAIVALLGATDGVRSVHDTSASAQAPATTIESSEPSNDTTTPTAATTATTALPRELLEPSRRPLRNVTVILRSDAALDLSNVMAPLEHFGAVWRVLEQTERAWPHKEVVLHVPEMMCPGNCGNTVVTAVRAVLGVETATLAFGARHVVVRGHMSPTELCSAVDAIGFAPHVAAVTPLPSRFRFRVPELVSVAFAGKKLEHVLRQVDGVERVVVHVEVAEVLVIAMLEDASTLLHATLEHGLAMVEVAETSSGLNDSAAPGPSLTHTRTDTDANDSDDASRHECDITVCPHNGCEQYRATVAHTAALAIGWSVPGCAMTWGGECTCGEKCKCSGCPTHNPPV